MIASVGATVKTLGSHLNRKMLFVNPFQTQLANNQLQRVECD